MPSWVVGWLLCLILSFKTSQVSIADFTVNNFHSAEDDESNEQDILKSVS